MRREDLSKHEVYYCKGKNDLFISPVGVCGGYFATRKTLIHSIHSCCCKEEPWHWWVLQLRLEVEYDSAFYFFPSKDCFRGPFSLGKGSPAGKPNLIQDIVFIPLKELRARTLYLFPSNVSK